MFEDSLVESSGKLKSKSTRYMWLTGAFNLAIVAVMILIPLLYPEALPKTAMTEMLRANAISAVQQWKYKPYLLNGDPTEVDTTITVNFSFGG